MNDYFALLMTKTFRLKEINSLLFGKKNKYEEL